MGSSWTWTLHLPHRPDAAVVGSVLDMAREAGLTPQRPDGGINAFDRSPDGPEQGYRVVGRTELVEGLVSGRHATNLWRRAEGADVWFELDPGPGPTRLSFGLEASSVAEHPHLHRVLTRLWTRVATTTGALFGHVHDEYSLDQIRPLLDDPDRDDPPAVGELPVPIGWLTYFDAQRYAHLPPMPSPVRAVITRAGTGTVVSVLDDPVLVDVREYERIHRLLDRR